MKLCVSQSGLTFVKDQHKELIQKEQQKQKLNLKQQQEKIEKTIRESPKYANSARIRARKFSNKNATNTNKPTKSTFAGLALLQDPKFNISPITPNIRYDSSEAGVKTSKLITPSSSRRSMFLSTRLAPSDSPEHSRAKLDPVKLFKQELRTFSPGGSYLNSKLGRLRSKVRFKRKRQKVIKDIEEKQTEIISDSEHDIKNASSIITNEDLLETERNLHFLQRSVKLDTELGIMPELSGLQKLKKLEITHRTKQMQQRGNLNKAKESYRNLKAKEEERGFEIQREAKNINKEFHNLFLSKKRGNTPKQRFFTNAGTDLKFSKLCRSLGHVKKERGDGDDGLIFRKGKKAKIVLEKIGKGVPKINLAN